MTSITDQIGPLIPALRRYARALLRDATAADDLVQDCLERAVANWSKRRGDDQVRAWLFAILHNLALNKLRQRKRRGVHVGLEETSEMPYSRAPSQEDGLRHRDLMRAVAALPEDQRAVLLLVSVEGLSYAETASALTVPIGTVMSRLARARDKVAQMMEGTNVVPLSAVRSVK